MCEWEHLAQTKTIFLFLTPPLTGWPKLMHSWGFALREGCSLKPKKGNAPPLTLCKNSNGICVSARPREFLGSHRRRHHRGPDSFGPPPAGVGSRATPSNRSQHWRTPRQRRPRKTKYTNLHHLSFFLLLTLWFVWLFWYRRCNKKNLIFFFFLSWPRIK